MSIIEALVLGIIQGVTEFLPVSSSGHLIVTRELFGFSLTDSLGFDIFLHLATLCAVMVYFRRDILSLFLKENRRRLVFVAIATIPAVIAGFLFKDAIETSVRSVSVVAWSLIAGSVIFIIAEKVHRRFRSRSVLGFKHSIMVGCFQALALIPGMSRSGMTISGGLLAGLHREEAVRFSFILSIPIILGGGLFDIIGAEGGVMSQVSVPIIAGAIAAFLSGTLAIHFLVRFLSKHTLSVFAWYRIAVAVLLLLFFV